MTCSQALGSSPRRPDRSTSNGTLVDGLPSTRCQRKLQSCAVPVVDTGRAHAAAGRTSPKKAAISLRIPLRSVEGSNGRQGFHAGRAVIAGIRKDIERYESERASAYAQVKWRVPVFLGALLIVAAASSHTHSTSFADPNEQWFSSPHIFLYFGTLVAAFFAYRLRDAAGDETQAVVPRACAADRARLHQGRSLRQRHHAGFLRPVAEGRRPAPSTGRASTTSSRANTRISRSSSTKPSCRKRPGSRDRPCSRAWWWRSRTITPFPGLLVAARRAGTVSKFFRDMFGTGGLEEVQSGIAEPRRGL